MLKFIDRLNDYFLCAVQLGPDAKSKCSIFWKETKNFRARLGLAKYHPDKIYCLQTTYGPLHFRDNLGDITNLTNLLYRQVYRVKAVPHEGVLLDIGANIGMAAVWFRYHNPGKAIYCFEPLPQNAAMIKLNCPDVILETIAVGRRREQITLRVDCDHMMASQIPYPRGTQEMYFQVVSLDEIAESKQLDQIALIKIDVEGMEVDILKGARKTLKRTYQVVAETHSKSLHAEAIDALRVAGFRIDWERFDGITGLLLASRS